MAKPTSQSVAAIAILMLAVVTLAVAQAPPKRSGQEVHLFEVTVRMVDGQEVHLFEVTVRMVDGAVEDDYNYLLLATVLGSVDAARSVMFETEPLRFSAYLTNNQGRRLSRVKGVLGVRQRDDPVPTAKH